MKLKTHSLLWLSALCAATLVLPAHAYSRERSVKGPHGGTRNVQVQAAPGAGYQRHVESQGPNGRAAVACPSAAVRVTTATPR
jgi:hypothetical protein